MPTYKPTFDLPTSRQAAQMGGRATEFQVQARSLVDAAVKQHKMRLSWTEEEGNLYPKELMIVGRTDNQSLTVWIYDDGIDAQIKGHPVANFEAESYPTKDALLQRALVHIEQALGKPDVRA
jgi:hypothetical protein